MIATLVAGAIAIATPAWIPVGQTTSRLRVFVERASVRVLGDLRHARVRIGSPTAIAGRIVLAYQDEEIDCAGRRWRLVGFEAQDEDGRVVRRSGAAEPPAGFLPAVDHTIGGEVVRTVCSL